MDVSATLGTNKVLAVTLIGKVIFIANETRNKMLSTVQCLPSHQQP